MRDYFEVVERLKRLGVPLELLGCVHDYPIYQTRLVSSAAAPRPVLITGGVHGDEPAGVESVLRFLGRDNSALLERFSFQVIPCINPTGYVHGTRETREGVDINRGFEGDDAPEVAIVKKAIGNTQYVLAMDFHEDYDATGFYLYEGRRNEDYIGSALAAAAKAVGPIDPDDPGEDAPDIAEGVYQISPTWGTVGLAPYLLHFHSEHVIIPETPTVWQLDQRVALHLTVLDTTLTLISGQEG